jgi:hypothetical protein
VRSAGADPVCVPLRITATAKVTKARATLRSLFYVVPEWARLHSNRIPLRTGLRVKNLMSLPPQLRRPPAQTERSRVRCPASGQDVHARNRVPERNAPDPLSGKLWPAPRTTGWPGLMVGDAIPVQFMHDVEPWRLCP